MSNDTEHKNAQKSKQHGTKRQEISGLGVFQQDIDGTFKWVCDADFCPKSLSMNSTSTLTKNLKSHKYFVTDKQFRFTKKSSMC